MKKLVKITDRMQSGYTYVLSEAAGKNFHPEFRPDLTPSELLQLGVFGGKYMTDCRSEFPGAWFKKARLSPDKNNPKLNYFKVNASLSLDEWLNKGWIYHEDPRGWFQWYCRYYMGRRLGEEDERQIKRWKAMKRHIGAIKKNCKKGDDNCRRRQKQALLHWAYDSRKL